MLILRLVLAVLVLEVAEGLAFYLQEGVGLSDLDHAHLEVA